jgi:hypothetical protein
MAADRAADALTAASAALAGVVVPQVLGPEALLWVLAALGVCSLADVATSATSSRLRILGRYLASVAVTIPASWAAGELAAVWLPAVAGHVWAVRIGAALAAGVLLHPLVAAAPDLMRGLIGAALSWLPRREG